MINKIDQLRLEILEKTKEIIRLRQTEASVIPGVHHIPYAGRVYDEEEVCAGVNSMLDFWLTLGPEGAAFEREFAEYLGVRKSILVNSGSSANLVAISSLFSHKLGEKRVRKGDEIITVAAGFPTTVAPIIQSGGIPVFIDNDPITGNPRVEQLEEAYVKGKTKAVMIAHALGNPFDLGEVVRFCREKDIWLVEDNCDSLGSKYDNQLTGTFGDLSTQSFYPPHHLTLGEGGALNINKNIIFKTISESIRDWGRDCWCPSGADNSCNKRFQWQLGELPKGYDHKFTYSHLGYNLKPLDTQAAIGRVQLKKLSSFIQKRKDNWLFLRKSLAEIEDFVSFALPTHALDWTPTGFSWSSGKPPVDPSWFGFMLLVKKNSPLSRNQIVVRLDEAKIGNRMLFGGNLVRQPAFVSLKEDSQGSAFRVIGDLAGADKLMNDALFIGVYPGLNEDHLSYIAKIIKNALIK